MLGTAPTPPSTVSTPPPTVSDTQESDTQADYEQRASRKRGLLSTILTNRRRGETAPAGSNTLG